MLTVVSWMWKAKPVRYPVIMWNTLRSMVERHLHVPHRFVVITDDPSGLDPRIEVVPDWPDPPPRCYRRLRMFSPEMRGILGPRFLHIDVDCAIVDDITPLVERDEPLVIYKLDFKGSGRSLFNPTLMLMDAGARADIWNAWQYNPSGLMVAAKRLTSFSDMGVINYCFNAVGRYGTVPPKIDLQLSWSKADPDTVPTWTKADGVWKWRGSSWNVRDQPSLPEGARIVFFSGQIRPTSSEPTRFKRICFPPNEATLREIPWLSAHWR
jgi:hypothetical protein